MPNADEDVVDVRYAYILTEKKALHLRASESFTDIYGIKRKAGEEWLLDGTKIDAHI